MHRESTEYFTVNNSDIALLSWILQVHLSNSTVPDTHKGAIIEFSTSGMQPFVYDNFNRYGVDYYKSF